MTFSTDSLAGWPLPPAGANQYIWAMSNTDAYVSYHGSDSRGIISVDWANGTVTGYEAGTPCDASAANDMCASPLTCGCDAAPARSRALLFGSLPTLTCICR